MNRPLQSRSLVVAPLVALLAAAAADAQTLNADAVVTIDLSDGSVVLANNGDSPLNIESYTLASDAGLLNPGGWTSLATAFPGQGWLIPPGNDATGLTELNTNPGSFLSIVAGGSQGFGSAFTTSSATLVAAQTAAGFGNAYLDVEFAFGDDDLNDSFLASVVYENELENNLVLEVNTATGVMTLINESSLPVTIDLVQISDPGNTDGLEPGGYTGLAGLTRPGWELGATNSPDAIAEFLPGAGTPGLGDTIAPGETVGSLGAAYDVLAAQTDLEFIFYANGGPDTGIEGVVRYVDESGVVGDYNNDGVVNAADYTVWRDNLNASLTLTNEDPAQTPGMVTIEDYVVWKNNFGMDGSVVGGFTQPAPEPSALAIVLAAALTGGWRPVGFRQQR